MLVTFLLLLGIVTIEIFLIPYPFGSFLKWYIPIAILGVYGLGISIEYAIKRSYYKQLWNTIDNLEEKYLATEIIKNPDFEEGRLWKEALEQINKSMIEKVNQYKFKQEDYKNYIE